jgi:hypothetical protein
VSASRGAGAAIRLKGSPVRDKVCLRLFLLAVGGLGEGVGRGPVSPLTGRCR